MNKKLRNMEYLLNFGSFILMFAIMFVVWSIDESLLGIKLVIGVISALIMLFASFAIDKNLKLTDSAKLFHFESIFLFFWFLFQAAELGLFGEWIRTDGALVFDSIYCILLGIASILTHVRYKNYLYINLCYAPFILSIYTLFQYLDISFFTTTLVVMLSIFIIYVFIKNNKYFEVFRYLLAIFCMIALGCIVSYSEELVNCISAMILIVMSIGILSLRNTDNETKYFSLIVYYYLLGASIISFNQVLEENLVVIIIAFVACLGDLLFNYLIKHTNHKALSFNKFVSPVFIFLISAYSLFLDTYAFIIVASLVFVSSLVIMHLFKDNSYEKYLFPYKAGLMLYAILLFISIELVELPDLVFVFALNLLYLVFYLFSKDNVLKLMYTINCIILLFFALFLGIEVNIVNFISLMFIMLLDYLILIIKSDRDSTLLGKIIYSIMLFISFVSLGIYHIGDIKYLIEVIFLLVLFICNDKIKYNIGITLPLLCFSICMYIDGVISNYVLTNILCNVVFMICLSLFTYYIFNKDKERDIFVSIFLAVYMTLFIIGNNMEMIITIYSLSIIVLVIITSLKVNYKYLFGVGIGLGVLALFAILNTIDGIPAAVYLLILGFAVVGISIYMISKYKKEDHKEEVSEIQQPVGDVVYPPVRPVPQNMYKNNFCINCGSKLSQDSVFCTNCGKKVVDK